MSPFTSACIDIQSSRSIRSDDHAFEGRRILDLLPGLLEDLPEHPSPFGKLRQDAPVVRLQGWPNPASWRRSRRPASLTCLGTGSFRRISGRTCWSAAAPHRELVIGVESLRRLAESGSGKRICRLGAHESSDFHFAARQKWGISPTRAGIRRPEMKGHWC